MEIRRATPLDAEIIADLLAQLGYPGTEGYIREKIIQLSSHPDAVIAVAIEDGVVRGFISIHFIPQIALPGSFARICYLCVAEGVRGRGVGGRLVSYCEHLARERGSDRIEVHCHSRRERAHEFYYRLGYEESPKYLMKKLSREPARRIEGNSTGKKRSVCGGLPYERHKKQREARDAREKPEEYLKVDRDFLSRAKNR